MEYSVSVCIPCYRDLAGLQATIESFVVALAEVPSVRCEFAVGLNFCDFVKSDVVELFDSSVNFSLSIAETDGYLEYDESVKFSILQATGNVCLLMGCGDIAKPGLGVAIKNFIDDGLMVGILPVEQGPKSSPVDAQSGVWQDAPAGFFNKVISGHLIDRKVLVESAADRFIGFEWAHVELAIRSAASTGGKTFVFSHPIIWRTTNSAGWWMRAEIVRVYVEYCFLVDAYHEKFPDCTFVQNEAQKSGGVRLFLTLLLARSNGLKELPSFVLLLQQKQKVSKTLRVLIRLSFLMPRWLVRGCYDLLVLATRLR